MMGTHSRMSTLKVIFFFALLLQLVQVESIGQIVGQFDTTKTATIDTLPAFKGKRVITIESYAKRFDPRKALLYSAVFPGSGQAYNKKYWKMPLVYGGFAVGIYVVSVYQGYYITYKNLLFDMLNDPTIKTTSPYTEDQLRQLVTTNRRQRDYFSALTALWYILQMVDAHVDAHLKEFDLNPQLQVRVEPSV